MLPRKSSDCELIVFVRVGIHNLENKKYIRIGAQIVAFNQDWAELSSTERIPRNPRTCTARTAAVTSGVNSVTVIPLKFPEFLGSLHNFVGNSEKQLIQNS